MRTDKKNVSPSSVQVSRDLRYVDIPIDPNHPFAYMINFYSEPTDSHYDIHQGLEIGIVLKGQSRRLYENYTYVANPGQIWFSGLWEPHGYEILKPNTRHLVIEVLPDFLRSHESFSRFTWLEIFQMAPKERPKATVKPDQEFSLEIAHKIISLMEKDSDYKLNWLSLALKEFLLHFMEHIDFKASYVQMEEKSNKLSRLYPAMVLIEKSYGQKITLAEAAKAATMSRSLFSSLFQQTTGITFGQYRLRIQLAAAINLLRTTDKKLEVIAQECGFTDASYFVRTFKQIIKQTPNEYRHTWRNLHSGMAPIRVHLPTPSPAP